MPLLAAHKDYPGSPVLDLLWASATHSCFRHPLSLCIVVANPCWSHSSTLSWDFPAGSFLCTLPALHISSYNPRMNFRSTCRNLFRLMASTTLSIPSLYIASQHFKTCPVDWHHAKVLKVKAQMWKWEYLIDNSIAWIELMCFCW